jgi:hypothetical protein
MENEILNWFQAFYEQHTFWSWVMLVLGFPWFEVICLIAIIIGFLI